MSIGDAKYVHTNIIAKDWRRLSRFYQNVFGMRPVPPVRSLSGEWLERLTGIAGVQIDGEHLAMPGYAENGPTLEIFTYSLPLNKGAHLINQVSLAHLAFQVSNVAEAVKLVELAGGRKVGEVVDKEYPKLGTATFAYFADIEGNIIELQSWH